MLLRIHALSGHWGDFPAGLSGVPRGVRLIDAASTVDYLDYWDQKFHRETTLVIPDEYHSP